MAAAGFELAAFPMYESTLKTLALSFGVSLAVTLALGPVVIPLLKRLKFGQNVRDNGPSSHIKKAGTPTMGGLIFLVGITVAVLWQAHDRPDGLVVLGVVLGYGLIGLLDDFLKVALKRSLGLRAREKLLGQVLLAGLLAVVAVSHLDRGTGLVVPFSGLAGGGAVVIDLHWWTYLLFGVLVVVGTANAVNLTDGLDGLAAGTSAVAAAVLTAVALWAQKPGVALVMAAVVGGCLGFLAYNRHPARVFMGDTGSLALGGGLGAAAVVTGSELFLLVIGGVFVLETVSVILQVFFFQVFGRRIFRMSPLHHHFELAGWSEKKVVAVFWAAALVFGVTGLAGLAGL